MFPTLRGVKRALVVMAIAEMCNMKVGVGDM